MDHVAFSLYLGTTAEKRTLSHWFERCSGPISRRGVLFAKSRKSVRITKGVYSVDSGEEH